MARRVRSFPQSVFSSGSSAFDLRLPYDAMQWAERQTGRGIMWHTSEGDRILRGAEAKFFKVALVGLESDRHRLAIAQEHYGCEGIVGDPSDWARQRDGLGCDGVIDAAGVSATLKVAIDVVRPAGWISKVGWGPQPLGFSLDPLIQKNVTLQGSFSHHWAIWERVLALLSNGQLNVQPIIGGVWPIDQWHEAFETMHQGAVVKSILKPL